MHPEIQEFLELAHDEIDLLKDQVSRCVISMLICASPIPSGNIFIGEGAVEPVWQKLDTKKGEVTAPRKTWLHHDPTNKDRSSASFTGSKRESPYSWGEYAISFRQRGNKIKTIITSDSPYRSAVEYGWKNSSLLSVWPEASAPGYHVFQNVLSFLKMSDYDMINDPSGFVDIAAARLDFIRHKMQFDKKEKDLYIFVTHEEYRANKIKTTPSMFAQAGREKYNKLYSHKAKIRSDASHRAEFKWFLR